MMGKTGKIMFYLTIIEIIASTFILLHDLSNVNLELGALVIGFIDAAMILYYIILNRVIKYINKKGINSFKLVILITVNILPILFYLHLLDYI